MKTIEELSTEAARVGAQAEELRSARLTEDDAAIACLEQLITLVTPLVSTIGTRPIVARTTTWHGNNTYTDADDERFDARCVALTEDVGPRRNHARDNDGDYGGSDLFLSESGKLIELTYSGSWSNWQGSGSEWQAKKRVYDSAGQAYEDGWREVAYFVDRLAKVLAETDLTSASSRAQDKAAQLRAMCAVGLVR